MKFPIIVLVGCAIAAPCLADEPAGCDKFKWPIDSERSLLTSADITAVTSGAGVRALPVAAKISLVAFADAKLPMAPQRPPRLAASFAGYVVVPAPPRAGIYKISLSSEAWVDVEQAGHLVKSAAFSGATACDGIRKSVKFDLAAEPFVVQISNVRDRTIAVAITAD